MKEGDTGRAPLTTIKRLEYFLLANTEKRGGLLPHFMTNIMMGLAIAFKTISLNQDYRRDDH
jgi:hypothetical protein